MTSKRILNFWPSGCAAVVAGRLRKGVEKGGGERCESVLALLG
jgi:hypothetical protein